MTLLLTILVYLLVAGLIWWIVTLLPLPAPFMKIAQVVVILVLMLLLIGLLTGNSFGLPGVR